MSVQPHTTAPGAPMTRRGFLTGVGGALLLRPAQSHAQDASVRMSLVDYSQLVNTWHPLARRLQNWWLYVPGISGTTTTWRDFVGERNGTLTSMAAPGTTTSGWNRTTSRQGGFGDVRFDGTNDYVSVADHDTLSFTSAGQDQAFTLSCMVWLNGITATQGVVSKWATGTATEWVLY